MANVAELLGRPLMPWQRYVADVALEVDEFGHYAYREIVVTVPRQSGKTHLMLGFELERVMFNDAVELAYTAQDGTAAKSKLLFEHVPQMKGSDVWAFVEKVYRTPEYPGVWFVNGSRITPLSGSPESGHGKTLELAVIDEAFADVDDRREQSLLAAMATRRNAQLLVCSTAGTDESVYLNRKNEAGRAAVLEDSGHGVAYFEWSATPGELEAGDWGAYHPAIGHTIDERVIEHARATMEPAGFARAWGNVPSTASDERPIPMRLWRAVRDDAAVPSVRPWLALAVALDRSHAAVAAADERGAVELLEYRGGTGWVVDRLVALGHRVVVDERGPAGFLVEPLRRAGVEVLTPPSVRVAHSCQRFVEAVADDVLSVRGHPALDSAVDAARRRWSGDMWFWGRKDTLDDVCPLEAATLAVGEALVDDGPEPDIGDLIK